MGLFLVFLIVKMSSHEWIPQTIDYNQVSNLVKLNTVSVEKHPLIIIDEDEKNDSNQSNGNISNSSNDSKKSKKIETPLDPLSQALFEDENTKKAEKTDDDNDENDKKKNEIVDPLSLVAEDPLALPSIEVIKTADQENLDELKLNSSKNEK